MTVFMPSKLLLDFSIFQMQTHFVSSVEVRLFFYMLNKCKLVEKSLIFLLTFSIIGMLIGTLKC